MTLQILGIDHKTASLSLRERCAIPKSQLIAMLDAFCLATGCKQVAMLSTCNRTEVYFWDKSQQAAKQWFIQQYEIAATEASQAIYHYQDLAAMQHGMRVAGGLESMIIGEPQIFGQMKAAVAMAQEAGYIASELEQAFRRMFMAGKSIRTETNIGRCPLSVARALVSIATTKLGHMREVKALLIGAGETNKMIALYLHQLPFQQITIANRSSAKAEKLATEIAARAATLANLDQQITEHDLIICATESQEYLITPAHITTGDNKVLVDLSIPRNIDPSISELSTIDLIHYDDLSQHVEQNRASRNDARELAEGLVAQHLSAYVHGQKVRDISPLIKTYRNRFAKIKEECITATLAQFNNNAELRPALELLAHKLGQQMMHDPTKCMRDAAAANNEELLETVYKLFDLEKY